MGAVYTQLSLQERRKIETWWPAKVPVREIVYVFKRHKSPAGQWGNGTPEQIGNRMIHEGTKLRVCQETIYRYIYSKEGKVQELWWYLPEHRKSRRPRRARKRQAPKFDRDVSILFRPDDVAHRRQFGHWEGDLMLFEQKLGPTNVTSLVERAGRFTVLLKNPNKKTKPVTGKIMKAVRDLPHLAPKCRGWKTPAEVFREKMMAELGQSPYPQGNRSRGSTSVHRLAVG